MEDDAACFASRFCFGRGFYNVTVNLVKEEPSLFTPICPLWDFIIETEETLKMSAVEASKLAAYELFESLVDSYAAKCKKAVDNYETMTSLATASFNQAKIELEILKLFAKLHEMGHTIVMITHDMNVAKSAKRIEHIFDGRLEEMREK